MSVTLNSTGITYSDGTSDYTNIIPTGTRVPFHMASAPTGWTQDTTDVANNRMLRFVNSTGGGSGGSYDPTVNSVLPAHTHTFTTGTVSADHSHGDTGSHTHNYTTCSMSGYNHAHSGDGGILAPNSAATSGGPVGVSSGNSYHFGGSSSDHTHSGTTAAPTTVSNWTPRYTDLIVCSKN